MLVLSRKFNEKLVLPLIKTTIQIVSIKPGLVRIGVDAPDRVKILREEINQARELSLADQGAMVLSREEKHAIYNQLNTVNLAVTMLQGYQERGLSGVSTAEAEVTRNILERLLRASEEITQILNQAMQEPDPKPTVSKKPSQSSTQREVPSRTKRRALLVEDDSNERELLAGLLELHGLEVISVEDGTDALEYLSHDQSDIALIDMMLPRKDGLSTIREIRRDQNFDQMKIYAMTGRDRDEFDLGPNNDGIDAWFTKPLDPRKLLKRLDKALGV